MSQQQPSAYTGPDQARRLAEAAAGKQLGAHRATYQPPRRVPLGEKSAAGRSLTVLGLAIPCLVLLAIVISISHTFPPAGVVLVVILLGIFFVGYVGRRTTSARNAGRELRLYEHGLIAVGTNGATLMPYRWDEVSVLQNNVRHYRNGGYTHTTYSYTLSSADAGAITLTGGFVGAAEWGPAIQEAVTAVQLPGAMAAVARGETLGFGDISVNRAGIAAGNNSVAWHQLQEVRVKEGYVSLKVEGRWRGISRTAVAQIPNFFVFLALADRLRTAPPA